jgi:glycosyltransferase involved in cell wall biosynthesis
MHAPRSQTLRILHVTRAPIGGLFRHMRDLALGQAARGHAVGVIADSTTGGARADTVLAELASSLALGVHRLPIAREVGPGDVAGMMRMFKHIRTLVPDVLHGHGAKGGACVRLAPARRGMIRVYTPHGGSLHYAPGTLRGMVYGTLERLLMPRTDLFLFESAYARTSYTAGIGEPAGLTRVVCNGVGPGEFAEVAPGPAATDLLFIGELRQLKGIDILLETVAALRRAGRTVTLTVVGEGPDGAAMQAQAAALGIADVVRFAGFVPAREAFALGRILVVPSRSESLPYVVLEASAAGVPMIATAVGGIPEIFGTQAQRLVRAGDSTVLAGAIADALDHPSALQQAMRDVREHVRRQFSLDKMISGVLQGYREALTAQFQHAR